MLLPPIPLVASLEAHAALLAVAALFTRVFVVPERRATARRVLLACAAVSLAAHAAWSVGMRHYPTSYWGAAIASAALPIAALAVASLPVAWLVRVLLARALRVPATRAPAPEPAEGTLGRRAFVQATSSIVPLAAASTGLAGFASDASAPRVRTVRIAFDRLHPDLEGLRILQLSDLHLGCARTTRDLEHLFARLAGAPPDLVVFTGDVAEDTRELAPALRLAHELAPRLGVYASLGNHEYLRDIRTTRPIYERSPVPLLVNAGHTLRVGRARLHLAGVDDPISVHAEIRPWLARAVDRALDGAPQDAFHLVLAHRPEAFDAAAARGADLVLSGHTHGGQIGYNGKSAFQPIWRERYLWGEYRRGASHLYTTSGFGDWYPFRLGCPTEAPVIVLASSASLTLHPPYRAGARGRDA